MTYHFIITVQLGPNRYSWDDLIEVEPGETRQDVFRSVLDRTFASARKRGYVFAAGDFSTLLFSLEPNELLAVTA